MCYQSLGHLESKYLKVTLLMLQHVSFPVGIQVFLLNIGLTQLPVLPPVDIPVSVGLGKYPSTSKLRGGVRRLGEINLTNYTSFYHGQADKNWKSFDADRLLKTGCKYMYFTFEADSQIGRQKTLKILAFPGIRNVPHLYSCQESYPSGRLVKVVSEVVDVIMCSRVLPNNAVYPGNEMLNTESIWEIEQSSPILGGVGVITLPELQSASWTH
ncbi:hypothetical protein BDZ94DRAFT_1235999 [Collybia nuda]|uniref:Uncharacterized protein n=1 Tax=Collybia nuda TaxID=64659 RepID=A0A9P5Y9G3_9AGAR|nr:hypothetical protein BDZ94DRAFT_1235999 [Collybia nuda]